MALIERVMKLKNDGTADPLRRSMDAIPVHALYAAMLEVAAGRMTVASFKTVFNIGTAVDASGRSDQDDINALVAAMPAAGTVARALFIGSIHSVFILAERRIAGYNTPALVRSKLGI